MSTRTEALAYLNERYTEQSLLFPLMVTHISRELYVRRNIAAAMKLTTITG